MAELNAGQITDAPSIDVDPEYRELALSLFRKSPLKQRKLKQVSRLLGDVSNKCCLDIGSDNGVISMLLREKGGQWHSCDLIEETVAAIRSLVGENVTKTDGRTLAYPDNFFDVVVIVDLLEHIESDAEFVVDVKRVLKSGGMLIANVPNPKEGLWRKCKDLLGQTDAAHGHVRPGYSESELESLFGENFVIESTERYGRIFSDLFDTALTFALDVLKGGRGKKGTVVTGKDLKKMKKSFAIYGLLFPFISLFVMLDEVFSFLRANMLIARARVVK